MYPSANGDKRDVLSQIRILINETIDTHFQGEDFESLVISNTMSVVKPGMSKYLLELNKQGIRIEEKSDKSKNEMLYQFENGELSYNGGTVDDSFFPDFLSKVKRAMADHQSNNAIAVKKLKEKP